MKYPAHQAKDNTARKFDRKLNPLMCGCEYPVPSGDYGEDRHGKYEVCEMCGKRHYYGL